MNVSVLVELKAFQVFSQNYFSLTEFWGIQLTVSFNTYYLVKDNGKKRKKLYIIIYP